MFAKLAADHKTTQFEPVNIGIDGKFQSIRPFLPTDLKIDDNNCGTCTLTGCFGFDVFSDNKFQIIVNNEMKIYTRFEDIPDNIDNVISFMPDISHHVVFTVETDKDTATIYVHRESTRWLDRLYELRRREKSRCLP